MSESEEEPFVLITREELVRMSEHYSLKWNAKSSVQKCKKWIAWFEKRYEKLFKDAAERGEYAITLATPFYPTNRAERDLLRGIRDELCERLPGCDIFFIEEEYEGATSFTLEISWDKAATDYKAAAFKQSVAHSSKDDSTQDSTQAPTSTLNIPLPSGDSSMSAPQDT